MIETPNTHKFPSWAESLRDRVSRIAGCKKNGEEPVFCAKLKGDLLDAIDLLLEHSLDGREPDPVKLAAARIAAGFDQSLKVYQDVLADALSANENKNCAALEKADRICRRWEAEYARQTGQSQLLREQLENWLVRQEQQLEFYRAANHDSQHLLHQLKTMIDSLNHQSDSSELERLRQALEIAQHRLAATAGIRGESEEPRTRSESQRDQPGELGVAGLDLEDPSGQLERPFPSALAEKEALQQRNNELQAQNLQIKAERDHLARERSELARQKAELEERNNGVELRYQSTAQSNSQQIIDLEAFINHLQKELQATRDQLIHYEKSGNTPCPTDELESQLAEAKLEIQDLKLQNSDLASQVAKQPLLASGSSGPLPFEESNLKWEDRKRLILQQFVEEESLEDKSVRTEIEKIIASTERVLAQKDLEFQTLQRKMELLGQEENDRIATTSKILDANELIQQERHKLQTMQRDWEEKLRQAEIDLSMARAKLAREITELEKERSNFRNSQNGDKDRVKTRKWLDHLGLRDDGGRDTN